MPEFKDKSKINAYSEDIIPTTAVDDFLDKKTVDRILTYYNDIDKHCLKLCVLQLEYLNWIFIHHQMN